MCNPFSQGLTKDKKKKALPVNPRRPTLYFNDVLSSPQTIQSTGKTSPMLLNVWACVPVGVLERGWDSVFAPSMHGHGSSLEGAHELWTKQNTQTRFIKTNEGSKHGRMKPPPESQLKNIRLSQRSRRGLNSLCSVAVLWMSSGWKHVLHIDSVKTRPALFSSVIYWSDEWQTGSGNKTPVDTKLAPVPAQQKACEQGTHSNKRSWVRLLKPDTGRYQKRHKQKTS